jgi:polyphosphate glucokinase
VHFSFGRQQARRRHAGFGIDIGGTGIKGAPVDTETGALLASRHRIPTPDLAKPKPVAKVVGELCAHFGWQAAVGCGFPAVVRQGVVYTSANIHKSWIETNAEALFSTAAKCPVHVLNDADAAGLAEMAFGAGKDQKGVVLMVTIGTGLGTVLFSDGKLVPNLELGHIELNFRCELHAMMAQAGKLRKKWKTHNSTDITGKAAVARFDHPGGRCDQKVRGICAFLNRKSQGCASPILERCRDRWRCAFYKFIRKRFFSPPSLEVGINPKPGRTP